MAVTASWIRSGPRRREERLAEVERRRELRQRIEFLKTYCEMLMELTGPPPEERGLWMITSGYNDEWLKEYVRMNPAEQAAKIAKFHKEEEERRKTSPGPSDLAVSAIAAAQFKKPPGRFRRWLAKYGVRDEITTTNEVENDENLR
mgnify:CR=1 FL=1